MNANSAGFKAFIKRGVEDRLLIGEFRDRNGAVGDMYNEYTRKYPALISYHTEDLEYLGDNAVDGTTREFHTGKETIGGEWLDLDMGQPVNIRNIVMQTRDGYPYMIERLKVSFSNTPFDGGSNEDILNRSDVTTIDLAQHTDWNFDSPSYTHYYNGFDQSARYVRLSSGQGQDFIMKEVELLDESGINHALRADTRVSSYWTKLTQAVREAQERLSEEYVESPGELVWHVVSQDKPYYEILTADYTMAGPEMQRWFIGNSSPSDEYIPIQDIQYRANEEEAVLRPHVGILSTYGYLGKFNNTNTNFHRHRASQTMINFLDYDIEKQLARTVSTADVLGDSNPTMNNPACSNCHVTMDPIAAGFQFYGHFGSYKQHNNEHSLVTNASGYEKGLTWYNDIRPAGYYDVIKPEQSEPLRWLAEQIVQDERFSTGTVRFWWQSLFGKEMLPAPSPESPEYPSLSAAYNKQQELALELGAKLSIEQDLKSMLLAMVMSDNFRSVQATEVAESNAADKLGRYSKVTPEQYVDRLSALTNGYRGDVYGNWNNDTGFLDDLDSSAFYGGLNTSGVTKRVNEMTPLSTRLAQSLAYQNTCTIVVHDALVNDEERTLLKGVDWTWRPKATLSNDASNSGGDFSTLPGLASRYTFEKTDNLAFDSITQVNSAVILGDVTQELTSSGYRANLTQTDQQGIKVPFNRFADQALQFSLSMKYAPRKFDYPYATLLNLRNIDVHGITIYQNGSSLRFWSGDGDNWSDSQTVAYVNKDTEHHFVLTYDGQRNGENHFGVFTFFLDGEQVYQTSEMETRFLHETHFNLGFGSTPDTPNYFNEASYDDIQVFNRALLPEEVEFLANDSVQSLYDADGDSHPDIYDHFPNNPEEWLDSDGDTIGNNQDTDDDNDGVEDSNDAFPVDVAASVDSDGDGYPETWNSGYSQQDSSTGLSLDTLPNVYVADEGAHYIQLKIAEILTRTRGKSVNVNDPEILVVYQLFLDVLDYHNASQSIYLWEGEALDTACDFDNGQYDISDLTTDNQDVFRAWRAVLIYAMTDFEYYYH
jgi:hypothetical protein